MCAFHFETKNHLFLFKNLIHYIGYKHSIMSFFLEIINALSIKKKANLCHNHLHMLHFINTNCYNDFIMMSKLLSNPCKNIETFLCLPLQGSLLIKVCVITCRVTLYTYIFSFLKAIYKCTRLVFQHDILRYLFHFNFFCTLYSKNNGV